MSNILLFESQKDQIRRLIFLLRLAGHECTVAHTTDEVINWLRSEKFLESGFELLLVGSDPGPADLESLLFEVQLQGGMPIICLCRHSGKYAQNLPGGITACHPEELISILDNCLPDAKAVGVEPLP